MAFTMGMFIVTPWGADVEDVDHGASTVPRLKQPRTDPPPSLLSEVQILQQQHLGEAVVDYKQTKI